LTRAAIYARVSTKEQESENQLVELRKAAVNAFGEPVPSRLQYIEAETGTGKRHRVTFQQMLKDAENHCFDTLIIWALDRFSREGPLKTMLLIERLHRSGVKVKSLKESWLDPESPTYELLLPIFAWIAKQEALRLSERTKAGLERARQNGQKLGRPKAIADLAIIRSQRATGLSYRTIGKALGISEGTVRNVLQRARKKRVRIKA
jgi:DNA invertase Pin-like site-specific DNA recombinase